MIFYRYIWKHRIIDHIQYYHIPPDTKHRTLYRSQYDHPTPLISSLNPTRIRHVILFQGRQMRYLKKAPSWELFLSSSLRGGVYDDVAIQNSIKNYSAACKLRNKNCTYCNIDNLRTTTLYHSGV